MICEIMIRKLITEDEYDELQRAFLVLDADFDGSINLSDFMKADQYLG